MQQICLNLSVHWNVISCLRCFNMSDKTCKPGIDKSMSNCSFTIQSNLVIKNCWLKLGFIITWVVYVRNIELGPINGKNEQTLGYNEHLLWPISLKPSLTVIQMHLKNWFYSNFSNASKLWSTNLKATIWVGQSEKCNCKLNSTRMHSLLQAQLTS